MKLEKDSIVPQKHIVGIDASNLRAGGGVTHLVELLRAANPNSNGFSQVIVWSGRATLDQLEDRPWLLKCHLEILDKNLLHRSFWQLFYLSKLARKAECSVLFVPGGSSSGSFHPCVSMSQNLLPFEWKELRRYGISLATLKLLALRWAQSRSFKKSDGLIFLTQYARKTVSQQIGQLTSKMAVIPHGIHSRFVGRQKREKSLDGYSEQFPFRILYVSIINVYKHQWHVAEAVKILRRDGLPIVLDLIGPAYKPALRRLRKKLVQIDPSGKYVNYLGSVAHDNIHEFYHKSDLCIFASSCENMPNILVEAMASGTAIACSNRGPMPEILGDAGMYFDPENPVDIAKSVMQLIVSPDLRTHYSQIALERSQQYSWARCADDTFSFLSNIARANN